MFFMIIFIILAFSWLIYRAFNNTKDILINKIQIELPDFSSKQQTLNILHLFYLHVENISLTPEQLEKKIRKESFDLIALTGDFLDRRRSIPKLANYLKILNKYQPRYGIYAVLGNHDYVLKGKHLQNLIDVLTEHNCHVLQNEHRT